MHKPFTNTGNEIIGKKIKLLREEKGMTQQELANIVGGDRQYISTVESGKKNITLKYLDKVAAALKVSQSAFLNSH